MARLAARDYTYFGTVRGMCRQCRRVGPSRVFLRDGAVWQQSLCPCSEQPPALIASDQAWYLCNALGPVRDRSPLPGAHAPALGCPHDCGPCAWHASPCQLPVFSVTNVCNLDCPICFTYNRNDRPWFATPGEVRAMLDTVIATSGPVDLVNITGGEPTLHPGILDLIAACKRPEVGRVTMNSNGLVLARDRGLCRRLAELDVCVVLSMNTLEPDVSRTMHGCDIVAQKLAALDNLGEAGVRTTLLCVLARGLNEDMPGRILGLMRERDNVLSLTVQTMTYTGHGGGRFPDRRHIPVDEAVAMVCRHSEGALRMSDFAPRPSAHPLCYSVGYLLRAGDRLVPFSRLAAPERVAEALSDSYLLRADNAQRLIRDAIDEAYAADDLELMRVLRGLVERLYPAEAIDPFRRQRVAEDVVRTVYVHAHMDEDTFDCARARLCPDLVPTEPGRLVPACTYNLFYRMRDARFYGDGQAEAGGAP